MLLSRHVSPYTSPPTDVTTESDGELDSDDELDLEEGDCVIRCGLGGATTGELDSDDELDLEEGDCVSLGGATSSDACDLLNSGVDIKSLSRDHKYRILTTNPNTPPIPILIQRAIRAPDQAISVDSNQNG